MEDYIDYEFEADSNAEDEYLPYIIFELRDLKYALSCEYVIHMEAMGPVTPMVNMDPHCRGMILYHGASVPVYDLRSMFGLGNFADELKREMDMRIQDHIHWVNELERCVNENATFTLTTDPHACAFGKWYDSFHTENSYLNVILKSIDEPHKRIHHTGEEVKRLMAEGKHDEAISAISKMKETVFQRTIELLGQIGNAYMEGSKEMLIYYQVGDDVKGIVVDSIIAIEPLDDTYSLPDVALAGEKQYIERIAKITLSPGQDSIVQVINAHMIA